MSRTYRHKRKWLTWDWYVDPETRVWTKIPLTDKKSKALAVRDGYRDFSRKWYFKQISIKRRRNDLLEIAKVYRTEDFEGYDFDDTPHLMKRVGIWWDIY